VPASIPALVPRDPSGAQFVLYSDSCSGEATDPYGNGARLARNSAVVRRLAPPPEFIAFPGDAVADGSRDDLWAFWLGSEMGWVQDLGLTIYQATSNHNTPSPESYGVYRKHWADRLPRNGPAGQETLSYWVRHGNLLYVSLHQPDVAAEPDSQPVRGLTGLEAAWLEDALAAGYDAEYVFVAGHYPVFPVNGYSSLPWCFAPGARASLWDILVRHGVTAYLCSHVLAFDAQVHRGVLQLTAGGAAGGDPATDHPAIPHGMMPGPQEYPHVAQLAVDAQGLRCQVLDFTGTVREHLAWPPPDLGGHLEQAPTTDLATLEPGEILHLRLRETGDLSQLVNAGLRPNAYAEAVKWLESSDGAFAAGFDCASHRLFVDIDLGAAAFRGAAAASAPADRCRWHGPALDLGQAAQIELLFDPRLGPGGLLWRLAPSEPWTSSSTTSAVGPVPFPWPVEIEPTSHLLELAWASRVPQE
jgi:hypothetical protein